MLADETPSHPWSLRPWRSLGLVCRLQSNLNGCKGRLDRRVIDWVACWRKTGRVEARRMGGDRHSHLMEAWAEVILGWIGETPTSP